MGFGGKNRFFKALAVLALLAMLVRSVAPAGYMLEASRQGGLEVVLCGGGVAHIDIGSAPNTERGDQNQDHGKARHDHCLFAASATIGSAPDQIALSAPLFLSRHADAKPISVHVGQGLAAPPPWSTGPPALV